MKELNKAIKQLKRSLNNLDKAEDKLYINSRIKEAELAEHLAREISNIIEATYDINNIIHY